MSGHDIQAVKIKLIDLIVHMPGDERLIQLYQAAIQALTAPTAAEDAVPYGAVTLRRGASKDQVFAEQGHKSPNWETHRALLDDLTWQHSSEELIRLLD